MITPGRALTIGATAALLFVYVTVLLHMLELERADPGLTRRGRIEVRAMIVLWPICWLWLVLRAQVRRVLDR